MNEQPNEQPSSAGEFFVAIRLREPITFLAGEVLGVPKRVAEHSVIAGAANLLGEEPNDELMKELIRLVSREAEAIRLCVAAAPESRALSLRLKLDNVLEAMGELLMEIPAIDIEQ